VRPLNSEPPRSGSHFRWRAMLPAHARRAFVNGMVRALLSFPFHGGLCLNRRVSRECEYGERAVSAHDDDCACAAGRTS